MKVYPNLKMIIKQGRYECQFVRKENEAGLILSACLVWGIFLIIVCTA